MSPNKKEFIDRKAKMNIKHRQKSFKRKRHPVNRHEMEQESQSTCASAKKLRATRDADIEVNAKCGYRILNFLTVFSAISEVVKCKTCNGDVQFTESSIRGLGFKLVIKCGKCNPTLINSCPLIAGKAYEINRRIAFVFKLLGLGFTALEKFCGLMDLPKSFVETMYENICKNIFCAAEAVGNQSMENALNKEKELNGENNCLTVSGDGTWQKRGFSSRYGVSSLIGYLSGKVLDITTKSSYCKQCEVWEKLSATPEYALWKESHAEHCNINHEGSAGKMEVDAICEMFMRSEEKYSVQYVNYVGDGDSKTFKAILECHPYKDVQVTKKECIGHVQKRMGSRLRNVKKQNKGLGGRGKLTDKLINELTVYYGLAIRRNSDNKDKMKNAIWSTFFHKISTDTNPQHQFCDESWCSYLKAKSTGNEFEHPNPLPDIVQKAIKPVYVDLTAPNLLERCEGGFTQNNNESLNSVIWSIARKTHFCGKKTIDFAAYTATSLFNDGYSSLLLMMQLMNIEIGPNAQDLCSKYDKDRIAKSDIKTYASSKQARQLLLADRKSKEEHFQLSEGDLYGPGIAD